VRLAVHHADIMLSDKIARGVVIGGPEGGVIPFVESDLLLDFETVERAGAIIGSGTLEVLPPNTCMVAWAQERSQYLAGESCGKCVPCRMGVKRIAGTLETIMSDLGSQDDLGLLEEFSRYVPDGSLCGFGVHAPNAVKTAMRYFSEDFRLHIHEQ